MTGIILHHYEISPYSEKVRLGLGLKGLAWGSVEIPVIMPKPDLTALTGGYRKTPVLQIGADIYCDSQLIMRELERRHPTPSFYPAGRGAADALAWWAEKTTFSPAVSMAFAKKPDALPEGFLEDRAKFSGRNIDPAAMMAAVPNLLDQLRAHFDWLDQSLADSRSFLQGSAASLADLIDLERFVPRCDIDPIYFDSPYYLYPDGPIAVETLRVIGAAMAEAGVVGLGRLTLSRRERMVMVEPRGTGMALFTLRAAGEVRASQFGSAEGDLDAEMVAIAGAIIRQRTGNFDPSTYHDRYQEALQRLIEAKMKGVAIEPRVVSTPSPVIDLMAALKRSLAQEPSAPEQRTAKRKQTRMAPDRRQP